MKVKLEEGASMPTRAFSTDAGLDLCSREQFVLWPGHAHLFDTGVHIQLPPGTFGMIAGRSGLNRKNKVCPAGLGIVDQGYTGSIGVMLYNFGKEDFIVNPGDRIAQMIIIPCEQPELELVDWLDETDRGESGFGSTGK